MVVVTHDEITNAIILAENVAYLNAQARAIVLSNGETPCKADNDKAIEIEQWITILERAEAQVENGCIDNEDVFNLIQKINKQYREVDCDVSRTFSRNSSSGGNDSPPTGYVERVLGVNVNNSNPSRPVVTIYVDGVTITGTGASPSDPLVAVGGGGGSGTVNNGTQYRIAYYATTGTAVSQAAAITAARVLISDSNGVPTHSTVTAATLLFLDATSSIQTQLNSKVAANSAITGATKTKVTFDSKGLVTSATDATTSDIAEGSNLYFTLARVLATVLSGLSITGGAITSSDTVLQAFGKLQNQINGISTPDLQDVTDVGNSTTNEIISSNGLRNISTIGNGYISIRTDNDGTVTIQATDVAASITLEAPNKTAGSYTIATVDDLALYVLANAPITGATKTKITYDSKGLVTSATDATTADIADSTNKRYQTDNQNTFNDATSSIQTQLDAKASKTFVENISLQDNGTSIAATTYTIELYAAYAYTINELKIIADAGTCTAALKINGTNVTGISAVSVSTTIATGTATAANTVAVGDKITLVTTSNSGLNNLQLSIKTTRI